MTDQIDLDLVWAETGGFTPTGDVKYAQGWVAEIPTYQHFNYVIQGHSKNLLALAEKGAWNWQTEINYLAGVVVKGSDEIFYRCHTDNIAQDPTLDATSSYWNTGALFGKATQDATAPSKGVQLVDINNRSATTWDGNDLTIKNDNALIALNTNAVGVDNLLLGNVSGSLVLVDIDTDENPDSRSIALADPKVLKIYHEGFKPTQADVSGTIPVNPTDGKMYARQDGNWVVVTSITVKDAPPPPTVGAGAGWYNLDDGQFYIDINDGDSSQWVNGNPPVIPDLPFATQITVDAGVESAEVIAPDTFKGNLDDRGLWNYAQPLANWNSIGNLTPSGFYSGDNLIDQPSFGTDTRWQGYYSKYNLTNGSVIASNRDGVVAARGKTQGSWGGWKLLTPLVMHVRDEKVSNTHGGASIAGEQIRDLNTILINEINGASLLSNQVTLPIGVYDIFARVPCREGDGHRASLYNVTDDIYTIRGSSADANEQFDQTSDSFIHGRLIVTSTTVFDIRHYIKNSKATYGLGVKTDDGGVEVYTDLIITQIAEA